MRVSEWGYFLQLLYLFAEEPSAPQSLSASPVDSEKVTLSWAAPENDGGEPVTGYIVVAREASKKKFKKCGKVDPSKAL